MKNKTIGELITEAREVPNPRTLRKISKYIRVNYNDLIYTFGLGIKKLF